MPQELKKKNNAKSRIVSKNDAQSDPKNDSNSEYLNLLKQFSSEIQNLTDAERVYNREVERTLDTSIALTDQVKEDIQTTVGVVKHLMDRTDKLFDSIVERHCQIQSNLKNSLERIKSISRVQDENYNIEENVQLTKFYLEKLPTDLEKYEDK